VNTALWVVVGMLCPILLQAQGNSGTMGGFHAVLDQLYDEMMPLSSKLLGVAQAIAGLGALWYIASRVYGHLARAESIDFYPLLRPFGIGICIALFPYVLQIINGVMKPVVTVTANMAGYSNGTMDAMIKAREDALKKDPTWQMYVGEDGNGDRERWYKYTHPGEEESILDKPTNSIQFWIARQQYSFRYSIRSTISEILNMCYEAAALCINMLRTFFLVVMSLLGPIVFGLSVFDAFRNSITTWLVRYVNFFLWLPVANIFGAILGLVQERLFAMDSDFFSSVNAAYIVFMLIGIVGYCCVPGLANYIVSAGGINTLLQKTNMASMIGGGSAISGVNKAGGAAENAANKLGQKMSGDKSGSSVYERAGQNMGYAGSYMMNKIKGNKKD
jgi:conjugative transposon TraJ protein